MDKDRTNADEVMHARGDEPKAPHGYISAALLHRTMRKIQQRENGHFIHGLIKNPRLTERERTI